MKIKIAPERCISEIQREFNSLFPYLKLEFYQNRSSLADYRALRLLSPVEKLEKAQSKRRKGNIHIDGTMKVNELEKNLRDQFSILAQVFRRSGNSWLQTSMTDNWTLAHQNNHGKEISDG